MLATSSYAILIVNDKTHKLVVANGKVEVNAGLQSTIGRTPVTDIFFLMHYAHIINMAIYLDTGVGKHRKIVDVSAITNSLGRDYCDALLFYCFHW